MRISFITTQRAVLKAIITGMIIALAAVACADSSPASPSTEDVSGSEPTPTGTPSIESQNLQTDDPSQAAPTATSAPAAVLEAASYVEIKGWNIDNNPGILWAKPNGIAIDSDGNIYTTEFQGNRVRKFNSNGELLLEWDGSGFADGQFNAPTGIAISPDGDIFVTESGNHRVQKFTENFPISLIRNLSQ